jgi:cytidine deaminase
MYTGVNVENRSFGLTICAERSALVSAIGAGRRKFSTIAIATPDASYPVSPCGACRQMLTEFMDKDTVVYFGANSGEIIEVTLGSLFPFDALHELGAR